MCVGELATANGGSDFKWERDHDGRAKLWRARHNWLYASLAMQPGKKVPKMNVLIHCTHMKYSLCRVSVLMCVFPFQSSRK